MATIDDLFKELNNTEDTSTPEETSTTEPDLDAAPQEEVVEKPAEIIEEVEEKPAPKAEKPEAKAPAKPKKPKAEKPAAVVPAENTAVAVVPAENTAVAEVSTNAAMMAAPLGQIGGQVDSADLILPRATLVHSVGTLSETFDPGSLVLDGEVEIVGLPDDKKEAKQHSAPYFMIPLKAVKVFRENLDYNDPATKDTMPREFLTEDEVVKNKGWVEFSKPGVGSFRPALNLLMAFVRPTEDVPEDMEHYFVDSYGDESFCIANMRLTKTAFRVAGKVLITDMMRTLRRRNGGLLAARYLCMNERVQAGDNLIWVPKFRLLPNSNEEGLMQYFKDLLEG